MQRNNIRALIERFLHQYGVKVKNEEDDSYVELMMDDHKYIEYESQGWYLPNDLSLDEEDTILEEMILNTFQL